MNRTLFHELQNTTRPQERWGAREGRGVTGVKELVRVTNNVKSPTSRNPPRAKSRKRGSLVQLFLFCALLPYRGSIWPQSRAAVKTPGMALD